MTTLQYHELRKAFDTMLIAEVNRHGGIPHLSPEEVKFRNMVAALLEAEERAVDDVRYVYGCAMCRTSVVATSLELFQWGWLDVSTHGNPNQWWCPACWRGWKKETR